MLKKIAILGLVLLIAGTFLFKWNLAANKKEQKELSVWKAKYGAEEDKCLEQYNKWSKLSPKQRENSPLMLNGTDNKAQNSLSQQGNPNADSNELATNNHPFNNVLNGESWQDQLDKYKQSQEKREFILTGSIVCLSTGATTFGFALVVVILRFISAQIRKIRYSIRKAKYKINQQRVLRAQQLEDQQKQQQEHEQEHNKYELKQKEIPNEQTNKTDTERSHEHSKDHSTFSTRSQHVADPISMLLSDSRSSTSKNSPAVESEQPKVNLDRFTKSQEPATAATATLQTNTVEESFKSQAEILEKQLAEVREMTQNVKKTTIENSQPLNSALSELTQQVSAIREYAAYQQERVEKLQDGYDWNIIRTFCLRVIRCIDNLETRLERSSTQDEETLQLEEVRDELIFALESSGIEQFKPEINSDYRGQEKYAEAVKDKEHTDNPEMAGKIARVIRPGYHYFINEESTKVVRTAQVKLFE